MNRILLWYILLLLSFAWASTATDPPDRPSESGDSGENNNNDQHPAPASAPSGPNSVNAAGVSPPSPDTGPNSSPTTGETGATEGTTSTVSVSAAAAAGSANANPAPHSAHANPAPLPILGSFNPALMIPPFLVWEGLFPRGSHLSFSLEDWATSREWPDWRTGRRLPWGSCPTTTAEYPARACIIDLSAPLPFDRMAAARPRLEHVWTLGRLLLYRSHLVLSDAHLTLVQCLQHSLRCFPSCRTSPTAA